MRPLCKRVLKEEEEGAYGQSEERAPTQQQQFRLRVPRPVRLSHQPGRAHAQEAEVPVHEVEGHGPQADGGDVGPAQFPHQHRIEAGNEGDGDVGEDIGDGEAEDLAIHGKGGASRSFIKNF